MRAGCFSASCALAGIRYYGSIPAARFGPPRVSTLSRCAPSSPRPAHSGWGRARRFRGPGAASIVRYWRDGTQAIASRSRSASWREFECTDREQGRVRSRRSPGCRSHGRRRSQLRRSANVSCSGWQRHQQEMSLRYAEGDRGCHHNQCLPCPSTERPGLPHSSGTSKRLT
jgi:hypothetical protein